MENSFAILACSSGFDGANGMLLIGAFLSFCLAVLMGIANVVMICVLEHRGRPTTGHLLGFLGYLVTGIVIFTGAIKDFKLMCVAMITVAIVISIHMVCIIDSLRRSGVR